VVDLLRLKAAMDSGTPLEDVSLHLPLQASSTARRRCMCPGWPGMAACGRGLHARCFSMS